MLIVVSLRINSEITDRGKGKVPGGLRSYSASNCSRIACLDSMSSLSRFRTNYSVIKEDIEASADIAWYDDFFLRLCTDFEESSILFDVSWLV